LRLSAAIAAKGDSRMTGLKQRSQSQLPYDQFQTNQLRVPDVVRSIVKQLAITPEFLGFDRMMPRHELPATLFE
jgi:hypothetical protein